MKFVDVTNDIAFRKIFGNENKKNALISFLNAVIKLPNNSIVNDVEILNPNQLPKLSEGKSTILDVKAKDNNGNTFIVEMQIAENEFFHKRVLYYTSQSYTAQIGKGDEYGKLKPVYFIGILEFTIDKSPSYFNCHQVLNIETKEKIFEDVEFNLIELPKFNKQISELTSSIDQWVYFIKNAENLEVIPESVTDLGLLEAYHQADKFTWQQRELDDYIRAGIKSGDEKYQVETAEKKGIKKGELNTKLEIAKNALKLGLKIEDIILLTGLSKQEIEKL